MQYHRLHNHRVRYRRVRARPYCRRISSTWPMSASRDVTGSAELHHAHFHLPPAYRALPHTTDLNATSFQTKTSFITPLLRLKHKLF